MMINFKLIIKTKLKQQNYKQKWLIIKNRGYQMGNIPKKEVIEQIKYDCTFLFIKISISKDKKE